VPTFFFSRPDEWVWPRVPSSPLQSSYADHLRKDTKVSLRIPSFPHREISPPLLPSIESQKPPTSFVFHFHYSAWLIPSHRKTLSRFLPPKTVRLWNFTCHPAEVIPLPFFPFFPSANSLATQTAYRRLEPDPFSFPFSITVVVDCHIFLHPLFTSLWWSLEFADLSGVEAGLTRFYRFHSYSSRYEWLWLRELAFPFLVLQ